MYTTTSNLWPDKEEIIDSQPLEGTRKLTQLDLNELHARKLQAELQDDEVWLLCWVVVSGGFGEYCHLEYVLDQTTCFDSGPSFARHSLPHSFLFFALTELRSISLIPFLFRRRLLRLSGPSRRRSSLRSSIAVWCRVRHMVCRGRVMSGKLARNEWHD